MHLPVSLCQLHAVQWECSLSGRGRGRGRGSFFFGKGGEERKPVKKGQEEGERAALGGEGAALEGEVAASEEKHKIHFLTSLVVKLKADSSSEAVSPSELALLLIFP
eukprot:TRINITY_DN20872_c0_g1_i1.p2 TRINITY_DN20872_c0_g1~~TRINITY_DN20872_c0_g1_i1.p2  ORF type:complete len:107 (-),score=22.42 TRINITY_DN20872_c0_g1_i1:120-440(-)